MQLLDDKDLMEALKEIKLKPVSEETRQRLSNDTNTSSSYKWMAVAALVLLTFTMITASFWKQSPAPEYAEITNPKPDVINAEPDLINTEHTTELESEEQRYILPQSQELVYIDDEPYHHVKYIILDREDVEIDGSVMHLVRPKEEQYFVPVTTF